jgi:mannose-6-phosphate isomerase class I
VIYKDNEKFRMHEHKTNKKYYRDRRVKHELVVLLAKLKLILGLRSLKGMLYIRALLEKIELSKQVFTLEIQDDAEVYISPDLSQKQLPLSFRYYDPLILIVQERMSDDRKDYFKMKNSIKKEIYHVADGFTDFLEEMGLRETKKEEYKKQAYKYTAINKSENN